VGRQLENSGRGRDKSLKSHGDIKYDRPGREKERGMRGMSFILAQRTVCE